MFLLLLNSGYSHSFVVVCRIQFGVGVQVEYLVVHAAVEGGSTAFLEVGATAAPYQQRVPCECNTLKHNKDPKSTPSEIRSGISDLTEKHDCGLGEDIEWFMEEVIQD